MCTRAAAAAAELLAGFTSPCTPSQLDRVLRMWFGDIATGTSLRTPCVALRALLEQQLDVNVRLCPMQGACNIQLWNVDARGLPEVTGVWLAPHESAALQMLVREPDLFMERRVSRSTGIFYYSTFVLNADLTPPPQVRTAAVSALVTASLLSPPASWSHADVRVIADRWRMAALNSGAHAAPRCVQIGITAAFGHGVMDSRNGTRVLPAPM